MTEEKDTVNERLNTLVFSNDEFGNIRTAVLDNNPWFVGKDVAECLEYKNTKDALARHVDAEDKRKPLTDEELATILKEKGYVIARRTVAKYREQLGIPVARLRKEI